MLLEGQGFGVLRRGDARTYVALDYGHGGGGHGHPDRLNLWLVDRGTRVLEDVGTGSYVDPSLHWYRSTLAHNAPLADARSQERVNGALLAWDEKGDAGWIDASAEIAPGVLVRRSVVAMADYLVDVVSWSAVRDVAIDLPWHVATEADGVGAVRPGTASPGDDVVWRAAELPGGADVEDGFILLREAECAGLCPRLALAANGVRGWVFADAPHEWWRATAPGPPGSPPRRFHLVRAFGSSGTIGSVWAWRDAVLDARRDGDTMTVGLSGGRRDVHQRQADHWRVEMVGAAGPVTRWLGGARASAPPPAGSPAFEGWPVPSGTFAVPGTTVPGEGTVPDRRPLVIPRLTSAPRRVGELTERPPTAGQGSPLRIRLASEAYRRSEASWEEAGSPEALLSLGATATDLFIEVSVRNHVPSFGPARADNPLDNEHPDINSDGVQLYLGGRERVGAVPHHTWILVPEPGGEHVRVTERIAEGGRAPLDASWRATPLGFDLLVRVARADVGADNSEAFGVDVIVNETIAGRERRRGQLVLSGGAGEWVYLRGDRQDPARYLAARVAS